MDAGGTPNLIVLLALGTFLAVIVILAVNLARTRAKRKRLHETGANSPTAQGHSPLDPPGRHHS